MNLLQLRAEVLDLLTNEQWGDRLLGTYTFSNGQTDDAIAVAANNYPPAGTLVTGLEVVIEFDYGQRIVPLTGGNLIHSSTQLHLKQWDIEQTTTEASDRLVDGLDYPMEVSPRVIRSDVLDNIESRKITLKIPILRHNMRPTNAANP